MYDYILFVCYCIISIKVTKYHIYKHISVFIVMM